MPRPALQANSKFFQPPRRAATDLPTSLTAPLDAQAKTSVSAPAPARERKAKQKAAPVPAEKLAEKLKPVADAQQDDAVAEMKKDSQALLEEAGFENAQPVETKYFLVYSALAPRETASLVRQLDAMYSTVTKLLGKKSPTRPVLLKAVEKEVRRSVRLSSRDPSREGTNSQLKRSCL